MARHLFVLGFMGTGKSTLAPVLAERRSVPFVDLDARIADDAGKAIPDIFRYEGEDGFRARELRTLESLAQAQPSVVACGGGIVTRPEALVALDRMGDVVVLTSDASVILERTAADYGRPMLNKFGPPEVSVRVLLDARAQAYARFPATVETSTMPIGELAGLVEDRVAGRAGVVRLPVAIQEASYAIRIGSGILDELGYAAAHVVNGRTAVVVSNPTVAEHYLEPVSASLRRAGFRVASVLMPDGESYKTLETAGRLYDACLEAGIDRRSVVVALGGGVVGDVAGFVAATVLRGVAVIQVPTTLLAMVDSSIGGKTGVDHPRGKNLIGAFHQPSLVWADLATLDTLPEREYRNGLAEVVKYGMIADPFWPADEWPADTPIAADSTLFAYLEAQAPAILERQPGVTASVVERCAGHKARVVAADEREGGVRAILNYGHTIGHALEAAAGYEGLSHGEAVALGMIAAGRIAVAQGHLASAAAERQQRLIARFGLPTVVGGVPIADVLAALQHDKKVVDGRLRFVLARAIGAVRLFDDVPVDLIETTLRSLECR